MHSNKFTSGISLRIVLTYAFVEWMLTLIIFNVYLTFSIV